ncbi:MAG: hypothetical protein ACD_5C00075G0014 [uncultured bacterium]|nr:MAG: hypothetical protein ACD_5C00075G0014 [uncultured bacterium]
MIMNQEKKFIAWDGEKWCDDIILHHNGEKMLWLNAEIRNNSPKDWKEDGLVQFIGIKDKDGVEIYEGYIVEIQHPCWQEKAEVKFVDGSFIFQQIKGEGRGSCIPGWTFMRETWQVKIIGNIFENPEKL